MGALRFTGDGSGFDDAVSEASPPWRATAARRARGGTRIVRVPVMGGWPLVGIAAVCLSSAIVAGTAVAAQTAASTFTPEGEVGAGEIAVVGAGGSAADVDRLYRMACLSVVRVRSVSALGDSLASGFLLGDGSEGAPKVVVTAFTAEGEPEKVSVLLGDRELAARLVVIDPTSRLGLLELEEAVEAPSLTLAPDDSEEGVRLGSPFLIVTEDEDPLDRALEARLAGRERAIRHRPLPVPLWRMHFRVGDAAFGAPVLDPEGRVAAMVLIGIPNDVGAAYAVPSRIVRKIYDDFAAGHALKRGWLGVFLEEGTTTPRILECRAGGPAEFAGLREGDVILRIGSLAVEEYWDVIEALYYLSPGNETTVEVLRGLERLTMPIVPGHPPARRATPDEGAEDGEGRDAAVPGGTAGESSAPTDSP